MLRRTGAALVGAVMALGALAGCGEDDAVDISGIATGADPKEFCRAVSSSGLDRVQAGDDRGYAEALRTYRSNLLDTGLPEGTPEEAVEGFAILAAALEGVDAGAIREAESQDQNILESLIEGEDRLKVNEYTGFERQTCIDEPSATLSPSPE